MKKCFGFLFVASILFIPNYVFSQSTQSGKTYIYDQFLPDIEIKQNMQIEISEDGKTYSAKILSGKYIYNCKNGSIKPEGVLGETTCDPINSEDAFSILTGDDQLDNDDQLVGGSFFEPERHLRVENQFGRSSTKTITFYNPRVTKSSLKNAKGTQGTPVLTCSNIADKLIGNTSYLYKQFLPDREQIQYVLLKFWPEKNYKAKIFSGKYVYQCKKGFVTKDEFLSKTECDPMEENDASQILLGAEELDGKSQYISGSIKEPIRVFEISTESTGKDTSQIFVSKNLHFHEPKKVIPDPPYQSVQNMKYYCSGDGFEAKFKRLQQRLNDMQIKSRGDSPEQKLKELKILFDSDLITQKEYDQKKKEILSEF